MATGVRVRFIGVLLVITIWPATAVAQTTTAPPAQTPNVTLGQAVDEIRKARALVNPGFDNEEPELACELTEALQQLEASGVLDAPLGPLAKGTPVGFLSTARLQRHTFESSAFLNSLPLRALWDTVRGVRNLNEGIVDLPDGYSRGILKRLQDDPEFNNEAIADMFHAYAQVDDLLQQLALEQARNRLGRYERKFGPRSVQMNALEVGIAYLLQDVKGFGYDPNDGPGPWEVVASYTTTYFSYTQEEPQVVAASEFGVRHYNFGDGWGSGGFGGFLKPGHWSAGMVVAGEKDGPLVWPWSGDSRTGAFVAWGDVKVAYVGGSNSRWLVSKQFQILPLTF